MSDRDRLIPAREVLTVTTTGSRAHRRTVHAVHVVIELAVLALLATLIYIGAEYEKGWDRRTDATVCRLAKQC